MSLQTFSPIDFPDCKQGVFVIEHTQKATFNCGET